MRRLVVAGLTSAVVLICAAPVAEAATISANTTADTIASDGQCSLREAVISANTNNAGSSGCAKGDSGADTVMLAGTYELSLTGTENSGQRPEFGDLDVTDDLTLKGDGAATTKIDAKGINRVIETSSGKTLHVEEITITGGRLPTYAGDDPDVSPDGGGIRAKGPLFLMDSAIVDNRAAAGRTTPAGIMSPSDVTASDGPRGGFGGGAYVDGTLTVTGSRIADNAGGNGGTGSFASVFPATTHNASGGEATGGTGGFGGSGGGLYATGKTIVFSSVLTGNRAGDGGVGGHGDGGKGNSGAAGGAGTGGAGGRGGVGGAVLVGGDGDSTLDIAGSSLRGNQGGRGGTGGAGNGGASGDTATAFGGRGIGGPGSRGGDGGAVANASSSGTVTISNSTFSGNVAGPGGVGGAGVGGTAFDNARRGNADGGDGSAGGAGGALGVYGGGTLTNVTIDQNAAGAGGAGGTGTTDSEAHVATGGDGGRGGSGGGFGALGFAFTLRYVTISANTLSAGGSAGSATNPGWGGTPGGGTLPGSAGAGGAGGAIGRAAGSGVTLTGSLLAYNQAPACFDSGQAGTITGGDENLVFPADLSCPGSSPADPVLGALQDNGGAVQTRAPAAAGSAVDRTLAGCVGPDARAVARPVGASCDVGAYELFPPSATSGEASAVTGGMATVAGVVNAHGPAGAAHFDYGTTSVYGSSSAPVAVGTGFADTPVSVVLAGLPAGSTIHYRVVMVTPDGTAAGADRTFTTAADAQPDGTAPGISSLSMSPATFAVSSKPTAVRRVSAAAKRKAHKGTTIKFELTEKAAVVLTFARKAKGRKVKRGGKSVCGKPGRKRVPRRSRCTRYVGAGSLRRSLGPGAQTIAFSGRIGTKALRPGAYRLTVVATDAAKNKSRAARKSFRIVR